MKKFIARRVEISYHEYEAESLEAAQEKIDDLVEVYENCFSEPELITYDVITPDQFECDSYRYDRCEYSEEISIPIALEFYLNIQRRHCATEDEKFWCTLTDGKTVIPLRDPFDFADEGYRSFESDEIKVYSAHAIQRLIKQSRRKVKSHLRDKAVGKIKKALFYMGSEELGSKDEQLISMLVQDRYEECDI